MLIIVLLSSGCTNSNKDTQTESVLNTGSVTIYAGSEIDTLNLEHLAKTVSDDFQYYGLSTYLGEAIPVAINETGAARKITLDKETATLVDEDWVGFRGRFESILIRTKNANIYITQVGLKLDWKNTSEKTLEVFKGHQDEFLKADKDTPDISQFQYIHLPKFLQYICRLVEWLFKAIVSISFMDFGIGIFVFALVIRLLMWPIYSATSKAQVSTDSHRAYLAPIHSNIKKTLTGEKAHKALMKSYKERGITPYFTLKPLLYTMLALPVLIAIFNMLGEVYALKTSGSLWFDSLAYPDNFLDLPFSIPFFGNRLNILPFIMTSVTVISASIIRNNNLPDLEIKRQKRNLYFMAVLFFLLFYNFPSGMILYWTIASTLGVLFTNYFSSNKSNIV